MIDGSGVVATPFFIYFKPVSMIQSTYNRGFVLKFSNGFQISVQINLAVRNKGYDIVQNIKEPIIEGFNASVTIYDQTGKLLVIDGESIRYHQTADMVSEWIILVKRAETKADILKPFISQKEEDWQ